ncbi:MAG: type III-B CRISPR module RAMP protein Cmr6 [Phaeodactylibacter sp.]|nr:type III-B CRISPR module RAMP protein Cmr6 [Phaeodactylibacter sp.]MCB9052476.1 type III-B CRISPR module RAMP protein Cmr6 [Lewinellaceae bacterium]
MGDNNLYNIKSTALPVDTKDALGEKGSADNFALLFNKLAHFGVKEDIEQYCGDIEKLLGGEVKAHFFHKSKKQRQELHLDLTPKWRFPDGFEKHYKAFLEGHAAAAKALFSSHVDLILKSNWRIAIGMGNESVYENGFTFHPTYGIPYLPGSSLKGMTRHWAVAEGKAREEIEAIFGTENNSKTEDIDFKQGQIIFFDAFPFPSELKGGCLQPDIMNNHYPDYYEGNKPPADWLSPRPIFFLTMKEVKFQFHLGSIPTPGGNPEGLLNTAKDWLVKALMESGVGAKTAVGYGRMGGGSASKSNRRKVDEGQSEQESEGEQPEPGAIKPTFQPGEPSKKLKNGIVFDAVVTEEGKPCLADIYGYGDRLHKQKPVSGSVQNLKKGDVILVSIEANGKKGSKIISATFKGYKKA